MTTLTARGRTAEAPRRRAGGRGLARAIWATAGACWVVTVAAILLGGHSHGTQDPVLAGPDVAWRLGTFAAAWTVMVGAMMLPSAIPMLELFWAASVRQRRPALVRAAMVIPYFAVWLGFAAMALAADAVVRVLAGTSAWLAARPDLVLGGVLVLAGAFQFTDLKKSCLTGCRSPLSMLWEHYGQGVRPAWALGVRHALLCLGCCWALMLVMVATGTGALSWMLLLTALMVAEKTTAWGARLVTPAGIAFIASGALIAVTAATAPTPGPLAEHAGHTGVAPDLSVVALLLVALVLAVWTAFAYVNAHDRPAGGHDHSGVVGSQGTGTLPSRPSDYFTGGMGA
jgi:predicted metal-binding membrane protein